MMQDYIAGKNVDHYLCILTKPGLEPEKQQILQGLLVEELKKLTRDHGQLELAGRRVRECEEHINKLTKSLSELNADDLRSQSTLTAVNSLQAIKVELEAFCRALRNELEPYVVTLRTNAVAIFRTLDEAKITAQRFAKANPGVSVTIVDRSSETTHVVAKE